jgi:tetratricopeptide (TPR) repeat protein
VKSLAARIDAMMDDDEPARAPEGALELDEIEEVDEVEDAPPIPPPRATIAPRAPALTPPPLPTRTMGVPVVMVPPRMPTPTLRVPPLGGRPPAVMRTASPVPVLPLPVTPPPSVAIPPRETEPARTDLRADLDRLRADRAALRADQAASRADQAASRAAQAHPPGDAAQPEPLALADDAPHDASSLASSSLEVTTQINSLQGIPLQVSHPAPVPPVAAPQVSFPQVVVPPVAAPQVGFPQVVVPPVAAPQVVPPLSTLAAPPPVPPPLGRSRRGSTMPPPLGDTVEGMIGAVMDTAVMSAGGVEVSTGVANIVVDQPLEAHLDSPTVLDRALDELGDAGGEKRAETMAKDLEAAADPAVAAMLAYELGELYERRLADEARAVKAFGRALTLDPGLRANLWAIRRVFYRRALWPNLVKLIAAEVAYARDDHERADLLLEKARITGDHMNDAAETRIALEEAIRIAPQHQAALLELERVLARVNDVPALLDVWERLADAVEHPARKIAYWLEVARTASAPGPDRAGAGAGDRAAGFDYERAQQAFDRAAALAPGGAAAERIARERLRAAEANGTPEDVASAIEALASQLIAGFGLADAAAAATAGDDRPDRAQQLRRELVALRRRQAQLARADAPERAWDVLQQAIAMSPGEPLVLSDLTELAEELGRYEDLAELVQSWQAVEGDPGRAMVLSIRRADALLRGGQRDQARALLAALEASAPGFIVLTSASERDALGRGDPGDLARTYLAAGHAALLGTWLGPGQQPIPDPGAAAALYVQAAELLAYEVGGPDALDEARGALGKALEAVPDYPVALEALTELDDTTGNVAEALARLGTQAAAATGDARRAVIERAIRLARSHGDLEAVLALETELVQLAPSELVLRWRLEATLAQLGRDDERAQLLGELATLESDAMRRGTAYLAAARLRERAGAVEQATELYRQVLALWPEDTFARESLIDLLRAQEKWTELVTERRAEARALPDGAAARRALREAAWVLEVRLNDTASAAQVYDEWLVRIPDDRTALEGAARCRASFGDRLGEVAARRALADSDPTPEAQWLLGRALERGGQFDEAADVFRGLAVREEPSVAATSAALALADLAAGRADTVMRVEATASLAGRTTEPRLGAALAEDSGWMYALVLEDFERAQQSFAAAVTLEPTRRGALLGAALVAARRLDPSALSAAYDGLAASVQMPEAAAALHLRAAAMAAASGDLELANQRVAAARIAAPDDTSALLVLAETGSIPQVDSDADDAAVVDGLLSRAEVLELRSALADDPASRSSWELDRAEALELAGRLREAGTVVAGVLASQPSDLRALEALRRLAKRADDVTVWAQASYQLARVIGDRTAKLALLRDAASVFDTDQTVELAIATYRRILRVDPGAPELTRLLELLRGRADVTALVALLSDRLAWLETEVDEGGEGREKQMVPLLLERATVLHGLGDHAAAMADLDALLDRAASNIEALRFRADLAMHAGDVESAVALWRRCLMVETRAQRRAEVELQLAQVLAENINDIAGAIENLESVVEASPEDLQLRERLLGLCLRATDWDRATREMRVLARLRPTQPEKAREELRLGLMLRDRLNDRTGARLALDRARTLDPLNLDVVRELAELLEQGTRQQVLASTAASFRASIVQNPRNPVLYERLAQVTAWQSDVDARWLALAGLEALGTPSVDQRQVLVQGRAKLLAPSRTKLDEASRAALRGAVRGTLAELWRAIAPAVQVATGVDAGKLGFARGDRVALKKLGDKYEPLATALACFGVEDVDIYISALRAGMARALAAETPILCLGADVAAAAQPSQRWLLGRAVATLAEGVATLAALRDGELGWTIAAAFRALELPIPPILHAEIAGEDASIAERAKILKKEMSRKAKATVQQIAQTKAAELGDVEGFRHDVLAIGDRTGLLWAGDLAVAHTQLDVGRGGKALTDNPSALELTAWSVSEDHVKLRDRIGVGLKGGR